MLQKAKSLKADGLTYNGIVERLKPEYPDVTYDKVREACRDRKKQERQEIVGVIGDTHFPFAHPNYINFLEDTFSKYKVTKIIHIGDICDNHAISRFQREADSYGACQEFDLALKDVEIYTRTFPKATLLLGNHCRIPERQAATLGIPSQRSFQWTCDTSGIEVVRWQTLGRTSTERTGQHTRRTRSASCQHRTYAVYAVDL